MLYWPFGLDVVLGGHTQHCFEHMIYMVVSHHTNAAVNMSTQCEGGTEMVSSPLAFADGILSRLVLLAQGATLALLYSRHGSWLVGRKGSTE